MLRDMILLFLGLACLLCSEDAQAYITRQIYDPLSYRSVYEQNTNRLIKYPLITQSRYYKDPYEKEEVDVLGQKPFYGGYLNFRRQRYDVPNTDVVYLKVPKQKILSMISPDELALLYQRNLAYDVPATNPMEPQQVAISSTIIQNLLKIKSGVGESIQGVGNFFGGLFNAGSGILGALGDTSKNLFWVNQG